MPMQDHGTSNELSHATKHTRLFSYIWQQLLQLHCARRGLGVNIKLHSVNSHKANVSIHFSQAYQGEL